jgi:hypothetical protein
MIKLTCEQIVAKIKEKTCLSEEEINLRIKTKLDQLAGLISKDGAAHIVANELQVNAFEEFTGKVKLNKMMPGMRSLEVLGKVIDVYDVKEFSTAKGSGKVGSFLMGDETGISRVTLWHAQTDKISTLKKGDVVKVINAYSRENNGRVEIHLNDKSELSVNPPGETVALREGATQANVEAQRKKIAELNENDNSVEILGTVVQVFEPRFFEVCPDCGKRARQRENVFVCEAHGNVTPDYSYVLNAVVDDGSETIRSIFFREQAEQLIRKPRAEIIQYRQFREKFDEVKIDLLGQLVKLTGRVTKNAMFDRLEFTARRVDMNPNPDEEIAKLNKQLGNETTV